MQRSVVEETCARHERRINALTEQRVLAARSAKHDALRAEVEAELAEFGATLDEEALAEELTPCPIQAKMDALRDSQ